MSFIIAPNATPMLLAILLVTTFTATLAQPGPDDPNPQGNGVFGLPAFKLPQFGQSEGSGSMRSGGFGFSFGGPNGGFSKGGSFGSGTTCLDQGPCYMKRLTCPPECFKSYSNSGNGFGYGGGSGGCNFDCKSSCSATC
ncbi:hypothetical protein vseg_011382 [Gypsophila vaccaria]